MNTSRLKTYTTPRSILAAVVALLCAVVTAACGETSLKSQTLDGAEAALAAGDIRGAVTKIDSLMTSADTATMDWKDYSRAFVVYAVAYDHDVEPDHALDLAARCLDRGEGLHRDSVRVFLMGQPADRMSAVQSVQSILSNSLTDPNGLDISLADNDIDPEHQDYAEAAEGHRQ